MDFTNALSFIAISEKNPPVAEPNHYFINITKYISTVVLHIMLLYFFFFLLLLLLKHDVLK